MYGNVFCFAILSSWYRYLVNFDSMISTGINTPSQTQNNVVNTLNFIPRMDMPNITYQIRQGEGMCIRMPNYDRLPIQKVQVKVPAFYCCKVSLDYQTKPRNFQFVLDKDNRVYSIDFKTNTFDNHIEMLCFDFFPNGAKNKAFSSGYVDLRLSLDFRSDEK